MAFKLRKSARESGGSDTDNASAAAESITGSNSSASANEPFPGYHIVPAMGWAVLCSVGICIRPGSRGLFYLTVSWLFA